MSKSFSNPLIPFMPTSTKHPKRSIGRQVRKKKPSLKKTLKRNKFLYINHKLLLKHKTFLHHFRDYLRGHNNDFDEESLRERAFQQRPSLSQSINRSGCINLSYLPKNPITYWVILGQPFPFTTLVFHNQFPLLPHSPFNHLLRN